MLSIKGKSKVHPRPGHERSRRGVEVLLYSTFNLGAMWGQVVKATPTPLYTLERDPVPIVQGAGWTPGPVWTSKENLTPTWILSPDSQAHSESLHQLHQSSLQRTRDNVHKPPHFYSFTMTDNKSVPQIGKAVQCILKYSLFSRNYSQISLLGTTEPMHQKCNALWTFPNLFNTNTISHVNIQPPIPYYHLPK